MASSGLTPLPNIFIDKYMPIAHPTYCALYIYCFRKSSNNRASISVKEMARTFRILESDVIGSFEYWRDKNLVVLSLDENVNLNINFIDISEHDINQDDLLEEALNTPEPIIEKFIKVNHIQLDNKPTYSPKELEMYKDNYEEINHIFSLAESALGKLLTSNDLSTIFGFYDWLRLPLDVIEVLMNYCVGRNQRNLRYMEKIAISWAEEDINTKEKALDHINNRNKDFRAILKSFGIGGREPVKLEIEFMKVWLYEYSMPLDLIFEACARTIIQTGQPQFKYADTILSNWNKNGARTLTEVEALDNSFQKDKKNTKGKSAKNKSKIVNYNQRTRDYELLEKLAHERLKSNLEGN